MKPDCSCNSGFSSMHDQILQMHNVSEMGGDLILVQNSMPQNPIKIELEVPGMLQMNYGRQFLMQSSPNLQASASKLGTFCFVRKKQRKTVLKPQNCRTSAHCRKKTVKYHDWHFAPCFRLGQSTSGLCRHQLETFGIFFQTIFVHFEGKNSTNMKIS